MFPCDTGSPAEIAAMASAVRTELGCPDILVNNAAAYYAQDFCDRDYDSW